MLRSVVMMVVFVATGCVMTSFDDVRFGDPRPARAASCEITWVSIDDSPANTRDQIAFVHLGSVGSDPMGAGARERVRGRACALGGDSASLVSSTNDQAIYLVWVTKARAPVQYGQ
jgi:hypothetical protein